MRGRAVLLLPAVLLAGCTSFAALPPTASAPHSSAVASTAAALSTTAPSTTAPSTAAPTTATAAPATMTQPGRVVVVLDPGHNGGNAAHPAVINAPVPDGRGGTKPCNTTGTATDAGYPEHAFTWDVALRTRDLLAARGVTVVLTRQDDTGVGPCVDARARISGQVGAVAFVGIHGDGAAPAGHGFHVISSSLQPAAVAPGTRALATDVRNAVTAVEPVSTYLGHDGLDVRSDLAGLNLNPVPAIYIECGNMRNASDAAWMSSPSGRQSIAARIAAGILTFLGR